MRKEDIDTDWISKPALDAEIDKRTINNAVMVLEHDPIYLSDTSY